LVAQNRPKKVLKGPQVGGMYDSMSKDKNQLLTKPVAFANQRNRVTIFDTENLRFNKFEVTKDFVLYSRDFVITGAFYDKINDRRTLD
jgi:hypothetical protein